MFFDIFKGKFGFKMSDDMGMDSDGTITITAFILRGTMIIITASVPLGTMMITIMVSVHHGMTITTASVHRGAMTTIGK